MPRPSATTGTVADPYGIRWRARAQVAAVDRRCRIARMADELMPMAVWYRQPKCAFYCAVTEGHAA
jgi:hypothetical protein